MNSDGHRCVPIARLHYGGGYRPDYDSRSNYRRSYGYGGPHIVGCGPGMNSNGYGCVPARRRGGYYYGW